MKAISFKIPENTDSTLRVQIDRVERFYDKLHFHPEYQITAIIKGEGILFMGNSFSQFAAGDVFILGSNVPHLFKNSREYYSSSSPGVHAISLFFTQQSFGETFFDLPELQMSKRILDDSNQGIRIKEVDAVSLFNLIVKCESLKGLALFAHFFQILDFIEVNKYDLINEKSFRVQSRNRLKDNMDKVIDYSTKHMKNNIGLDEVAKISNLSISQFSKRFKAKTNKTYVQFLNELRVESACTTLRNTNDTIQVIAGEVGFINLANFNRQFKKIKGISPSVYRKQWRT